MKIPLLGVLAVMTALPALAHSGPLGHTHGGGALSLVLSGLAYAAAFFPIAAAAYAVMRWART